MRSRKRVLVTLATVLLVMGLATIPQAKTAQAYNLLGGRWTGPGSGVCCLHLAVTYDSGMYSRTITGWDNGRYAWNQSTALVYFDTGSDYTILLSEWYDANTSVTGTTWNWPSSTSIPYTGALSELNKYYTSMAPIYFSDAEIQATSAHELGHVLGLAHHVGPYLMDPANISVIWPTSDDIAGVNAMY